MKKNASCTGKKRWEKVEKCEATPLPKPIPAALALLRGKLANRKGSLSLAIGHAPIRTKQYRSDVYSDVTSAELMPNRAGSA